MNSLKKEQEKEQEASKTSKTSKTPETSQATKAPEPHGEQTPVTQLLEKEVKKALSESKKRKLKFKMLAQEIWRDYRTTLGGSA